MFRFRTPQKIFQIGKVRVGGQPGELPTVLIGSIFYAGHKIVDDQKTGAFDRVKAEALIKRQEELSDIFGNPGMLDVVGTSPEAMIKYIDFVSEITDIPFLMDAVIGVRLEGLKRVAEAGLADRVVYDSIYFRHEQEINAIKEAGVKTAILLAFNARDHSARGCVNYVNGEEGKGGLLDVAGEAGVEKTLVDTCGTNVPRVGIASKAAFMIKDELGLPAGFSPENAVAGLKGIKERMGEAVFRACWVGAQVIPLALCCDFILYGPIEGAEYIFPACSAVNSMIAAAVKELGTSILIEEHPLRKLYPDLAQKLESGAL